MRTTALRYGMIAGIAMLLINILPMMLMKGNPHQYEWGEVLGYTGMVLGLVAVFFGIRHHRDGKLGGAITFGRAVGLGTLISLVAAVCFVVGDVMYIALIEPDFANSYCTGKIAALEAANAPSEKIQEMKEMHAMMTAPGGMAIMEVMMFFTVVLIGTASSLISAAVLKRERAV